MLFLQSISARIRSQAIEWQQCPSFFLMLSSHHFCWVPDCLDKGNFIFGGKTNLSSRSAHFLERQVIEGKEPHAQCFSDAKIEVPRSWVKRYCIIPLVRTWEECNLSFCALEGNLNFLCPEETWCHSYREGVGEEMDGQCQGEEEASLVFIGMYKDGGISCRLGGCLRVRIGQDWRRRDCRYAWV